MLKLFSRQHTNTPQRFMQLVSLLIFTLIVSGCTGQFQVQPAPIDIEKSPIDERNYLTFKLENQLKVLVISDQEADKAAAALSVSVGSGSDPKDREGLAHFLEHMLFLGTEKYPEADAYQRYISEHGGSHNAYTAFGETNYFFDINASDLQPALDQFAQFFISPLFNEEYVEREKHAVHSEYQAKIRDDSRRQYEVFKTLSNPEHPFSQFSVGSLETLAERPGKSIRDDLLTFYHQHYSANLMTLVVLGNESTETLRQLVTDTFSEVANYNSPQPEFKQPLFTQLPLQVNTEPNKNLRRLVFNFPVPSTQSYYQSKPVHYLTNLLGHEGEGSLLSYLKQQGWADSLSAGMGFETNHQGSLQIAIGLTEAGLQQTDAIASALFQTVELIREQGLASWRYDEQAQLAALAFRFQQNSNNMHYVTRLASQLHHVPASEVLSAPYQMKHFDRALLESYLAEIRPDNLLLVRVAKGLPTEQKTKHFNAPYKANSIDQQTLSRWLAAGNASIQLPKANPFVPENLAILNSTDKTVKPQQTSTVSNIKLWHASDTSFKAPRADFYFTLRSPLAHGSARNEALTALLVKTVNEQLNEFSYPASLAGLGYQLYPHVRGISVRISGYQDKQSILLEEILKALAHPEIENSIFTRHKDELERGWQNTLKQKPYQQSMRKISDLLTLPSWSEAQLIAAIKPLTEEDLENFNTEFMSVLDIEVLANGNIDSQQAQAMSEQLNDYLSKRKTTSVSKPKLTRLPNEKLLYSFGTEHNDSAVTLYTQGENKDINTQAHFSLLNQVVGAPFFHELRTKQQLGYIVFSSPMTLMDVPALAFTVQSPNTPSDQIISAIERFIREFSSNIEALDETTLATHKQALISRILEKDSKLSQRSNRYWYEIDRMNFNFDTREQLVDAIKNISLEEIKQSYRNVFIEQPHMLAAVATPNSRDAEKAPSGFKNISQTDLSNLIRGYFEN